MENRNRELRIPAIREDIKVDKTLTETARLNVRTRVRERRETVEVPLNREEYTIERVPVGREVDAPVEMRQDGDVTIVPVHEEELVVTRRLVLKEELHIRRRVTQTCESREVTLRSQDVEVEREAAPPPSAGPPGTH